MAHHFDVAVLGLETSGLIAAALLAKRGKRVLLIDEQEEIRDYLAEEFASPESRFATKGVYLPPLPLLLANAESSLAMQEVHQELGLTHDWQRSLTASEPSLQVILGEHRLSIGSETKVLVKEFILEFPAYEEKIKRFFQDLWVSDKQISDFLEKNPALPPANWRERFRYRSLYQSIKHLDVPFVEHPLFLDLLSARPLLLAILAPLPFLTHVDITSFLPHALNQTLAAEEQRLINARLTSKVSGRVGAPILGGLPSPSSSTGAQVIPTALQVVRLLARYFRGLVNVPYGTGENTTQWSTGISNRVSLQNLLLQSAKRAGVTCYLGSSIRHLEVRGRKLSYLEIANERLNFSADLFVANTRTSLAPLLHKAKGGARFVLEEQLTHPTSALLVLNLLVHKQVIPKGMGRSLVLLPSVLESREIVGAPLHATLAEERECPPILLQRYPAWQPLLAKNNMLLSPSSVRAHLQDEQEILSAAVPMSLTKTAYLQGYQETLQQEILQRLREVIPFLDDFVITKSAPTLRNLAGEPDTEALRQEQTQLARLYPFYTPRNKPFLGIALRGIRTYYHNLWHAGRDVLPGLGLEGEYITGMAIARTLGSVKI